MYCAIKNTWVEVMEDDGRVVRKLIGFRGPIESTYMSGNDKVVVTYSNGSFRYTELWDVSGKMIRRTRC